MDPRFLRHLQSTRSVYLRGELLIFTLRAVRAIILAVLALNIWAFIKPESPREQLIVGLLSLVFFMALGLRWRSRKINADSLLKTLEVRYEKIKRSAFALRSEASENYVWQPVFEKELKETKKDGRRRFLHHASTLVVPTILLAISLQFSPQAMGIALDSFERVVASFAKGNTLVVLEGMPNATGKKEFSLPSSDAEEITLIEKNRIEITVTAATGSKPYVLLKPVGSDILQTFRLTSLDSTYGEEQINTVYRIAFQVREESELFLSTVSTTEPVSKIKVLRLPVPKVQLSVRGELIQPWPDERPLPLQIEVSAESPIQLVRLQIKAGKQTHSELVSNVLADDKKTIQTDYMLLLENYVESDVSTVEIFAEAVDRHLPSPLLGRSETLIIEAASAYGRYRKTLATLKEIKTLLDEAVGEEKTPDQQIADLLDQAAEEANVSPFFDGLDRHNLRLIKNQLKKAVISEDRVQVLELSDKLNEFLFEHESLDDRERDRDFFVAVRALSRLIEQDKDKRALSVDVVTGRLSNFLDERFQRWQLRLKYMDPSSQPKSWPSIQKRPFKESMDAIAKLMVPHNKTQPALEKLSATVADYRAWIEELEAAEDKSRKEQEQKRQEGLANSKNQLRELQKRQAKISTALDQSANQKKEELADKWGAQRMKQNTNEKEARSLEGQMRSLSPIAAERIAAAAKAMETTLKAGDEESFALAESASDMAARLLTQAQSAASKSQKKQSRRGRRRRVASDDYYGSQVAGGDVEIRREYEVSRRYREEILNEVKGASTDNEAEAKVLENYLRKVIR